VGDDAGDSDIAGIKPSFMNRVFFFRGGAMVRERCEEKRECWTSVVEW
jgi:hypothetical protein